MRKLQIGLVAMVLAASACGNGSKNNDNNTNNNTTNGTTPPTTNTTTPPNNVTSPTNNTNTIPDPPTIPPVTPDTPPTCSDTPPPARCAVNPADQVWEPASVINSFTIEGTDTEPVCCFDYTNDGNIDNQLGQLLAGLGQLVGINQSITESLESGSLVLVLEHDGLTALSAVPSFNINFFIGAHDPAGTFAANGFDPAGGNLVLLNPESFDDGSHPQAYLPSAAASGAGAVTAGPGSVAIEVTILGTTLLLTISNARVAANINPPASGLDTGIALNAGQLGGVIQKSAIATAVNQFVAGGCACLGLSGPLVADDSCSSEGNSAACTGDNASCATVNDQCTVLVTALGSFADVDYDGDGIDDSISIGTTFTALGADITGVQ